ncbi:MAG: hypothetical protein M3Y59_01170 [Myxococcota bacterium]|nr:hypothetical protein [Myxococcota bacterium]
MSARRWFTLAVITLLCGPPAWAQEGGLGLDLTAEEAPAAAEPAPASLGLDLTEPSVELRPTLAIAPFELEESALDSDEELAIWLQTKLVDGATRSGAYAKVIGPEEVTQTLGTAAEALAVCTQADCLGEAADTLEVERLMIGRIRRDADGAKLVLWGHRREAQDTAEQEIPLTGEGLASAWTALRPAYRVVEGLSVKLVELTVQPSVDQAESRLGRRLLGPGQRKDLVPDGVHTLEVTAQGYLPHQQELTLTAGGQQTVEVTLQPVPKRTVAAASPRSGPPPPAILTRPGLYVAAIGVVALGIASGLGASVAAAQAGAVDANGDGVIDITRAEMLGARRNANTANVLFVAGGLAAVGGGTWLVLSGSF